MEIPLLADIVLVLGLSVAILLVSNRIALPPIVGLLLTGVIVGPGGLALLGTAHEVEVLAEIGVVMLLFTIGIEFSLAKLFEIRRLVVLGGAIQVVATTAAGFAAGLLLGLSPETALFIGFLVSLSSTAIVLKGLLERTEIESPHGQLSLAILIFQDVAIVPMILVTPMLAGSESDAGNIWVLLLKIVGVLAFVWLAGRFAVPWLLDQIVRTRSRELFVLSVVAVCLTIAFLTSSVGLSLGLGAFLAGLIISESPYGHHALGGIMPLRDVFTSLFFVSIGMLLDVEFLIENPLSILAAVVATLITKSLIVTLVGVVMRRPVRNSVHAGIALSQVGEFAFILAGAGLAAGLIGGNIYQGFLASSVITMAVTPFLLGIAPKISRRVQHLLGPPRKPDYDLDEEIPQGLRDHLVIVGYGFTGRNVAHAARSGGIPFVAIDSNAETIRSERSEGRHVIFGDASYETVLEQAGVEAASVVVVAINDPIAARRVIQTVRGMNAFAHLIVRTRFVREIGPLLDLGASEVIPEEFETSVEISTRILARFLVPHDRIEAFVEEVRMNGYMMYRSASDPVANVFDVVRELPDAEVSAIELKENSPLVDRSPSDIDMRRQFGVTLVEIRRGLERRANPDADTILRAGDIMVVMGSAVQRRRLAAIARGDTDGGTIDLRDGLANRRIDERRRKDT